MGSITKNRKVTYIPAYLLLYRVNVGGSPYFLQPDRVSELYWVDLGHCPNDLFDALQERGFLPMRWREMVKLFSEFGAEPSFQGVYYRNKFFLYDPEEPGTFAKLEEQMQNDQDTIQAAMTPMQVEVPVEVEVEVIRPDGWVTMKYSAISLFLGFFLALVCAFVLGV